MSDEPKPKGLYTKLAEVMAEVGRVEKRGYNDFHKYHYVREDDLVEAVRGALSDRQIVMLPSALEAKKEGNLTTLHLTFTFVDGETGEAHAAEWFGTGEDKGDKGLYKAYTGAIKYFLMKSFLIPTGDDPDGAAKAGGRRQAATVNGGITKKLAAELIERATAVGVNGQRVSMWLTEHAVEHAEITTKGAAIDALRNANRQQAAQFSEWLDGQGAE